MAGSKSLIPPKAQIPVAVVLGILFALLLVWRFGFGAQEETESVVSLIPEVDAAEIGVSLDDLREILKELQVDTPEGKAEGEDEGQLPLLSGNPFRWAQAPSPRPGALGANAGEGEGSVQEPVRGPSRESRLNSLVLSGTCVLEGSSTAIVGERYVKVGDVVEGFTIQEIRESELTLADDVGVEIIKIEKPEWLGTDTETPPNTEEPLS